MSNKGTQQQGNKSQNITTNFRVGFHEPIVSYHAEHDPYLTSSRVVGETSHELSASLPFTTVTNDISEQQRLSSTYRDQSEYSTIMNDPLRKRELNANAQVDTPPHFTTAGVVGRDLTTAGYAELRTNPHDDGMRIDGAKRSRRNDSSNSSILEKSMSLKTFDMSKQKNLISANSDMLAKLKNTIRKQKENSQRVHTNDDPVKLAQQQVEKPRTRKIAVGPGAPKYKGFSTAQTRIRTSDGKIWKEDGEESRLSHTRMYKPDKKPLSKSKAASILFSKSIATGAGGDKSMFSTNINKTTNNNNNISRRQQKPTRKTGKITSDKAGGGGNYRSAIITPASWKESKKKVEMAMLEKKTTNNNTITNKTNASSVVVPSSAVPDETSKHETSESAADKYKSEESMTTTSSRSNTQTTTTKGSTTQHTTTSNVVPPPSSSKNEERKKLIEEVSNKLNYSSSSSSSSSGSDDDTLSNSQGKRINIPPSVKIPIRKIDGNKNKAADQQQSTNDNKNNNSSSRKHYDPTQVKRYMAQQKANRRKEIMERKRQEKEAEERKKQLLDKLDQRQKEARKKQLIAKARKVKLPAEDEAAAEAGGDDEQIKSTMNTQGYQGSVAAFMEKLDRLRDMSSAVPQVTNKQTAAAVGSNKLQDEQTSNFMSKLNKYLQEDPSYKPTTAALGDTIPHKVVDLSIPGPPPPSHIVGQPWSASTPNLSPQQPPLMKSSYLTTNIGGDAATINLDKIASIKAKSESLQKRIVEESQRFLHPGGGGMTFMTSHETRKHDDDDVNKLFGDHSMDWLKKSNLSTTGEGGKQQQSMLPPSTSKLDRLLADSGNHHDNEMTYDELNTSSQPSLPGYKSPLPGVGELVTHTVDQLMENLEKDVKNRQSKPNNNKSPSSKFKPFEAIECWMKKSDDDGIMGGEPHNKPLYSTDYTNHFINKMTSSSTSSSSTLNGGGGQDEFDSNKRNNNNNNDDEDEEWMKEGTGDKYSIANLFTRKYLRSLNRDNVDDNKAGDSLLTTKKGGKRKTTIQSSPSSSSMKHHRSRGGAADTSYDHQPYRKRNRSNNTSGGGVGENRSDIIIGGGGSTSESSSVSSAAEFRSKSARQLLNKSNKSSSRPSSREKKSRDNEKKLSRDHVISGGDHVMKPLSPVRSKYDPKELISWANGLNNEKDVDTSGQDNSFTTTPPRLHHIDPFPADTNDIAVPSTSMGRYSPSTLEKRMALELGRFDTIDEAITQLGNTEQRQSVALAQQDTVSISNILQSRQHEHELEVERLALKAKEEALLARENTQDNNIKTTKENLLQREQMLDERRKMDIKLQEETRKNLKVQAEVAQLTAAAARKLAGYQQRTSSYKDDSSISSYDDGGRLSRKFSYSTSAPTATSKTASKHRISAVDTSDMDTSSNSTTSYNKSTSKLPSQSTTIATDVSLRKKIKSLMSENDSMTEDIRSITEDVRSKSITEDIRNKSITEDIRSKSITEDISKSRRTRSRPSSASIVSTKRSRSANDISTIHSKSSLSTAFDNTEKSITEDIPRSTSVGGGLPHDGSRELPHSSGSSDIAEESRKAVLPYESHRRHQRKRSPSISSLNTSSVTTTGGLDQSLSSDDHHTNDKDGYPTRSPLDGAPPPHDGVDESSSLFSVGSAIGSFHHFMNVAVNRYMHEQHVRTKHQQMILQLREKAVKEKAQTELSWLEQKKQQLRNKGEDDKMPPLMKKRRAILRRLQVEQEEIKKLKAANKAASKDQELILKQHQALSRCREKNQKLKDKINKSKTNPNQIDDDVTGGGDDVMKVDDDVTSIADSSDISTNETARVLKRLKKVTEKDGRHLTVREKSLMKRKRAAEKILQWKKQLDEEEKQICNIERQALSVWSKKESSGKPSSVDNISPKKKTTTTTSSGPTTNKKIADTSEQVSVHDDKTSMATTTAPKTHRTQDTSRHTDARSRHTDVTSRHTDVTSRRTDVTSRRTQHQDDDTAATISESSITEDIVIGDDDDDTSSTSTTTSTSKTPRSGKPKTPSVASASQHDNGGQDDYSQDFDEATETSKQLSTKSQTTTKQQSTIKTSSNIGGGEDGDAGERKPLLDDKKTTATTEQQQVTINKQAASSTKHASRRESGEWSDESFSQTQSETEQSDVECRVRALKEELRQRRLVADRLKKQQKKKHKESLRAQEASLKSQIEAYDAYIKKTQQELSQEIDNSTAASSAQVSASTTTTVATKPQIRSPRKGETQQRSRSSTLRNISMTSSPDQSPRATPKPTSSLVTTSSHGSDHSDHTLTQPRSSRLLVFESNENNDKNENSTKTQQSSSVASSVDQHHVISENKLKTSSATSSSSTTKEQQIIIPPLQRILPDKPKDVVSPSSPPSSGYSDEFDEDICSEASSTTSSVPLLNLTSVTQQQPTKQQEEDDVGIPPAVDYLDDDDKTPVPSQHASPLHTPTPSIDGRHDDDSSSSSSSSSTTGSVVSLQSSHSSHHQHQQINIDDCDSSPEDDRLQKQQKADKENLGEMMTDSLFNNLLQDAFSSTADIRNKIASTSKIASTQQQQQPSDELLVTSSSTSTIKDDDVIKTESSKHRSSTSTSSPSVVTSQSSSSSIDAPKMSSSAKNLLQLITSPSDDSDDVITAASNDEIIKESTTSKVDEDDDIIESELQSKSEKHEEEKIDEKEQVESADEITNNLLQDAISQVLEVRKERRRKWSNNQEEEEVPTSSSPPPTNNKITGEAVACDVIDHHGEELATIMQINKELDVGGDQPTFHRPVSPIFGASQDDAPEDWFYDFEDFSQPPNFSSKTAADIESDDWKDEDGRKALELATVRFEPPPMIVPHRLEDIMELVDRGVDHYYEKLRLRNEKEEEESRIEMLPEEMFLGVNESTTATTGVELHESDRIFKLSIFYLVRDLTNEIFESFDSTSIQQKPVWSRARPKRRPTFCRTKPATKEDFHSAIRAEVSRLFNFDRNLQRKPDVRSQMKSGITSKKRDRVDHILTEEMRDEEAEWVDYDTDETSVKLQLAEMLFEHILQDTIKCFDDIEHKRNNKTSSDRHMMSSSSESSNSVGPYESRSQL